MDDLIAQCTVHLRERLVDAMRVIDRSGFEIALAVDDGNHLVGTLTDGDIRRALLSGQPLEAPLAPHICRTFTSIGPEASRAEVLDLMRARLLTQIPIVDQGGLLVGLHLLHQIIGATERMNWAVVMAGGEGVRLRPFTETMPKPMLKVAGRPILERIVLHLTGFGIRRIFLAVNYLGHLIEEHFGDGERFGCTIEYLREAAPRGSGGALSALVGLERPLLVMNGDLVTQADLGALLDFHEQGGQLATMAVRRYAHVVPFGCVELEGDRIVRVEEKPTVTQTMNAGIYVLSPEIVKRVPAAGSFGLPTLFEQCLARGETVRAFEIQDDWIDVGQHQELRKAREGAS